MVCDFYLNLYDTSFTITSSIVTPSRASELRLAFVSSHIDKSLQFEWFQQELARRGVYQVHFIINNIGRRPLLAGDLERAGIAVEVLEHNGWRSLVGNTLRVRKALRRHRISTVHTTLPYGNVVGQLAAMLAGIRRRVTTCENISWAHDFKNARQLWIDRFTFRAARRIVLVADSAAEYAARHWHLDPAKTSVIYHGLDVDSYSDISEERVSVLRTTLGIPRGGFIIGMIARLELWKGHEYAIRAMKLVIGKAPEARLMIFGSAGADRDKIMSLIRSEGLEDVVFYKGFVNDPIALFRLFDVHLHIPVNRYVENCGISIIEGMISAVPQVLTLSGYAAQSAVDGHNALVVDYCNHEQVAHAILRLHADRSLGKALGTAARNDAIANYSNKVKTDRHLALYQSMR